MTSLRSGTVMQSGLKHQPGDYWQEFITHPVLAVVLNVYYSDDPFNVSSQAGNAVGARGSHVQARVMVVNDGSDSTWELPNVVITPSHNPPGDGGLD